MMIGNNLLNNGRSCSAGKYPILQIFKCPTRVLVKGSRSSESNHNTHEGGSIPFPGVSIDFDTLRIFDKSFPYI